MVFVGKSVISTMQHALSTYTMSGAYNYHIARYTLTGRKLGESTFKTQEEAKKFIRDYLKIAYSDSPNEELLEKFFDNVDKNDGMHKFLYGNMYFFITKVNNNS